jgi:hypothetical protein
MYTLYFLQEDIKFVAQLLHIKITHFNSVASVVITSVVVLHLDYKCCKCHKHHTSILPMSCL